ncbi:MAG: hypothetical protein HKN92_10850 [Chitinophagales bacterium]|nr:hypothetical protein [Chitinophagales bacterium]
MRRFLIMIITLSLFATSCKEDAYTYGIVDTDILPVNAVKSKQKTDKQYVSILYANLFQKALSSNRLVELERVIESLGDKRLARELIISSFMNDPAVILPSDPEMRDDIDQFVIDTYKRFYVRPPTEIEKEFFRDYINNDPNVTVEQVYFAFAISDEYMFY